MLAVLPGSPNAARYTHVSHTYNDSDDAYDVWKAQYYFMSYGNHRTGPADNLTIS